MKITAKEFTKIYRANTNKYVADKLGVSCATIATYAKQLGISKGKGHANRNKLTIT